MIVSGDATQHTSFERMSVCTMSRRVVVFFWDVRTTFAIRSKLVVKVRCDILLTWCQTICCGLHKKKVFPFDLDGTLVFRRPVVAQRED